MDVREKLIEILRKPIFPHELVDPTEAVADYLLDSGRSVDLSTSVLAVAESIRIHLFGELPAGGKKDPDIRCAADALRQQLYTSEEALSQLRFIAERLGV